MPFVEHFLKMQLENFYLGIPPNTAFFFLPACLIYRLIQSLLFQIKILPKSKGMAMNIEKIIKII